MNILASQIGIDVAKDELVVSIDQGKPFAISNTVDGCLELINRLDKNGVVHMEASGGYERLARKELGKAGIKVVIHNPLKPKRMAQAKGVKAKTDAVDAKALSAWGADLPEGSVKTLERQQLADHSRAIETLKEMVRGLKKRMAVPELDPSAKQIYAETILDLQKRIDKSQKELEKRIRNSPFKKEYELIQSVPALGKVAARICVCEFPEDLSSRTPDQIACYGGLAPINNESGKRIGKAHLKHGNSRLKAAFYMPALTAKRTQAWAKELYARLIAKGRCHQAAMVAIMRRLLVRAVAVVKRGSSWKDEPPKA